MRFFGTDGLDTEQHARAFAEQNGMFYLSPYNDAEVMCGQGSCGVEIIDDLPDVDAVFVAVGGGGLIACVVVGLIVVRAAGRRRRCRLAPVAAGPSTC